MLSIEIDLAPDRADDLFAPRRRDRASQGRAATPKARLET
jgi:hypothetical protein